MKPVPDDLHLYEEILLLALRDRELPPRLPLGARTTPD